MRKEIIEKILEEYNVFSCDNSALADRLLKEFSPEGDYIKKSDAISKILTEFVAREENGKVMCACADVKQTCADILDSLPTYSFPDSAENKGEWIDISTGKGIFKNRMVKCSVCGNTLDLNGVNCGRGDANCCPNCFADMRPEPYKENDT